MTWRIELANGAIFYTDTPLDFDRMGRERWVCIEAISKAVSGDLLRGRPTTRTWLNIAQIAIIREAGI